MKCKTKCYGEHMLSYDTFILPSRGGVVSR
nr:MAG TPA: hypothetical protein [Caudoviricetes sp.]